MIGERTGPLAGIRVLDVGRFVAGPVAATILGEFGAEVIKVERPGSGDDLRRLGWAKDGNSLWWSVEARNKDSITLNLADPRGQDLLLRLVEGADVLVENFRPGTLERWGLDWDTVRERNERLVLLRTSGYGQTGPYREKGAFNTAVESLGGLRYIMGEPDRPPARPGVALGDYVGALTGVIGVLLALFERDGVGSGSGQWIDNALYESVMRITEYTVPAVGHLGRVRERVGGGSVGTVPARSFLCSDDVWVGVSAANDAMWARLATAIGRPELASDPRSATNAARIDHAALVHGAIEAWCAERTSEAVLGELDAARVSGCEVFSADRLLENEQVAARHSVQEVPDPLLGTTFMQTLVPTLSRTPGRLRHAGPELGSANDRIYRDEMGLDSDDLGALQAAGVI